MIKLVAALLALLAARAAGSAADVCDEDSPLRIAFLILVHNDDTLSGASRLVDALYHEDHTFYVHFDTKMKSVEYDYEWRLMSHRRSGNLRKFSEHNLAWGRWVMLAPWFTVANILVGGQEKRDWDYFINLSGDSYPVLRPEPLRRRLAENGRHLNYMTSSSGITGLRPNKWSEFDEGWHKRKAFPFPILEGTNLEAHFGSQWMVGRPRLCQGFRARPPREPPGRLDALIDPRRAPISAIHGSQVVTRDFVKFVIKEKVRSWHSSQFVGMP